MTVFGIVYAIFNTVSFQGYVYNEVTVESPIEGISGGTSVILLIVVYLLLGRVSDIKDLLHPARIIGIIIILISIIVLAIVRNREQRKNNNWESASRKSRWKMYGLGTLVFPIVFAIVDALETIVTGVCLDTTYGYSMPEGDSLIIVGMEYAFFALAFWIYTYIKERKFYQPFRKENLPRMFAAVTDNVGIVFYSFAMAMDSVSTDPVLAIYPVLVMLGGRIFMKEKLSVVQYICLFAIIAGSVLVCIGAFG
ncbi:MAG: EamA family transporter [Parasporobacterium sp.]|nr:EamA family transporter [Parasporobacterium sp.]